MALKSHRRRYFVITLVFWLWVSFCGLFGSQASSVSELFQNLKWRQIGPACFGGRIDDIEAVPENPQIIFIATASGGIFKSTNNGITWKAVFDKFGTSLSIGDIAIAPSDPNIIWAGTGEPNNRQSSSWGDGVYKSLDGGETWVCTGLKDTHHIGRVVIHPQNPEVVFVAALGHLWGPNSERGLFRTKDGGKTWEKILFINENTGVVDVALEENGRILYAAAYQRQRKAWGFVGGGPHGGLYRSLDGGETWTKLTTGMPEGDIGRIGIAISKSHPNIVYAIIENKQRGGVYKSEDRGDSWVRTCEFHGRPMYYSQLRVDPQNPNKIWLLDSELYVSIDGGKTFSSEGTGTKIHVDHHALWINPRNSDHLLLGGDGGFYMSYDGSKNWHFVDNLPIGQYYAIGVDNRSPYWVYGGTQDNGTWGIPSQTYSSAGILNTDVVNIAYGDGFYVAVDPKDHTAIYAESQNGRLYFVDLITREEKGIRPLPEDPEKEYRWNWSSPLLLSPHDSNVLYYGANKLLKTSDRGHSWTEISPDLTRNLDWKKLPIMGVERDENTLSRDDGVAAYGTITTISESPLKAGLIYVGTDDGQVQMTQDGGKTWQNLTDRFKLPGPRWVSRVLASCHSLNTAYVSFDGHQDDDFAPYIFKTENMGRTWVNISGSIPHGNVVNAIAEHPRNPMLLFAGTEFGLFFSTDGGKNWSLAGGDLPRAPIDDIIIHPQSNDLILGTHGRSIIIFDDLSPFELLSQALTQDVYLFPVREAVQFYEKRNLPDPGASKFVGPNPDYGALITYYLKDDPVPVPEKIEPKDRSLKSPDRGKEKIEKGTSPAEEVSPKEKTKESKVKIIIIDSDGKTVRELEGPDKKGIHRVSWDLRYPLSFEPKKGEEGWFGPPRGHFVLPGEYTIKLVARNQELIQKTKVSMDPQAKTDRRALQARFEASSRVSELQRAFKDGQKATESIDKELKRLDEILSQKNIEENIKKDAKSRIEAFRKKFEEKKKVFVGGWDSPLEFRIMDLAGQLQASTSAPTQAQLRMMDYLAKKLEESIEKMNEILTTEFPELEKYFANQGLKMAGLEPIKPPQKKTGGRP